MAFVGCVGGVGERRERLKVVVVMYLGTCVFPYCRTDVPTNCKQGSKVLVVLKFDVYFLSAHNPLSGSGLPSCLRFMPNCTLMMRFLDSVPFV